MKSILLCLFLVTVAAQAQWTKVSIGSFNNIIWPGKIVLVDGSVIYAGSDGLVCRSRDGGATFTKCNDGIYDALSGATGMLKVGNRLYVSFGGNGGRGIYYSTNEGDTWIPDTAGYPNKMFAKQIYKFQDKYIFGVLESNFTVYKSIDDASWKVLNVPSDYRTPSGLYFDGDTIFVSQTSTTVPKAAYTTDFGATWNYRIGKGLSPLAKIFKNESGKELYSSNSNFATFGEDWLIRSTDNGFTWDTVTKKNKTSLKSVYASGDVVIAAFGSNFSLRADTVNKIILSTDRGNSWTDLSGDFNSKLGFYFHSINSLAVYDNKFLFGGVDLSTGLLKREISLSTSPVSNDESAVAEHVYPNPTADVFRVDAKYHNAPYELYNATGQIMSTGQISNTAVDVSVYNSGVYMLRIYTGATVHTLRIVKM